MIFISLVLGGRKEPPGGYHPHLKGRNEPDNVCLVYQFQISLENKSSKPGHPVTSKH